MITHIFWISLNILPFIYFLCTAAHVSFDSIIYIFNLPTFFPYPIHFLIPSCIFFMVFGFYFINTMSFYILWNTISSTLKCSFDFCREIIFIVNKHFDVPFIYSEIFSLRPVLFVCLFLFLHRQMNRAMFRLGSTSPPSFIVSIYTCLGLLFFPFVFTWVLVALPRFIIRCIWV